MLLGTFFPAKELIQHEGGSRGVEASRNIVAHLGMKQTNSSLTKGGSDLGGKASLLVSLSFLDYFLFSWPHGVTRSRISCGSLPHQLASPGVTQPYPALAVILSQICNYLHRAHARVWASSGYLESAGIPILVTFYTEFGEEKSKSPLLDKTKGEALKHGNILCVLYLKLCSLMSHWIPFRVINCFNSELEIKIDYETRCHCNLNMLPWAFTAGVWRLRQQKALVSSFGKFISIQDGLNDTWERTLNLHPERKVQIWPLE